MSVEPVIQLANKYRSEFEQNINELRQRSAQLGADAQAQIARIQEQAQQLQPLAKQKTDELQQVVAEMTPVEGLNTQRVMETFTWIGVLCGAYSIVNGITAMALSSLVFGMLDTSAILVLAFGALPYIAYAHVRAQEADDTHMRFKLLAFAIVEGLLCGALMHDSYLSTMGPIQMLTPMVIGIVAHLAASTYGSSRQTLLGLTVGASAALHLAIGFIGGQMSFGYLLLTVAYTAIGLVTLQSYIHHHAASEEPTHIYQFAYTAANVLAHAFVYLLFSSSHASHKESSSHSSTSVPSIPYVTSS